MAGGSVRAIVGTGKQAWTIPEVAFAPGLLARARALAVSEAKRARIDVPHGVRLLSEAYTRHRDDLDALPATLARYVGGLGFFFARDLPKAISVVDELAARDLLPRGEPLRILDLGAGFGTTSLGVARWAHATGFARCVEIDAVERDAGALDRMTTLAAPSDELPTLHLRTHASSLEAFLGRNDERYHLVLLGLALNELAASLEAREALVRTMLARLTRDGVLVIVEPALHDTARDLMQLRDRLAADPSVAIVGPCTHARPCPMLAAGERDWCHVDLPLELPDDEAAIARAAGLRDVKPTFAWLAIARGPREAYDVALHRVVSRAMPSKGKQEIHVCGDGSLRRLTALDRDRVEPELASLRRGALVALTGPATTGPSVRLGRDGELARIAD